MSKLLAIRKRLEAATPGPWLWNVNLKHKSMQLESVAKGRWNETVMRFVRWGMQHARIEFCGMDGLMEDSLEYLEVVPGREHHKDWYQRINHRDANLIANAPTDIAHLLSLLGRCKPLANMLTGYIENELSELLRQESVVDSKEIKRLQEKLAEAENLLTDLQGLE